MVRGESIRRSSGVCHASEIVQDSVSWSEFRPFDATRSSLPDYSALIRNRGKTGVLDLRSMRWLAIAALPTAFS